MDASAIRAAKQHVESLKSTLTSGSVGLDATAHTKAVTDLMTATDRLACLLGESGAAPSDTREAIQDDIFDETEPAKTFDEKVLDEFAVTREAGIENAPVPSKPDPANPKDKIGAKKINLHLVPTSSIIQQARAMEQGAAKYGPFNWREKEVRASIYVSACMRHLFAWFDGQELADDSGIHHLGHALACLGILIDAQCMNKLLDDRVRGPSPEMIAFYDKSKDKK